MTFASIDDVSTRLGRPITDPLEVAQVTAWLEDVESIILRRIPDLDARVTAGNPPAATVVRVEANAVIRKIRNPDGKVSETIDDYTYRLGGDARRSDLFLTDDEWSEILPVVISGAFSTRPGFEPDRGGYVPLNAWELNL